jgi:hypothetical protein
MCVCVRVCVRVCVCVCVCMCVLRQVFLTLVEQVANILPYLCQSDLLKKKIVDLYSAYPAQPGVSLVVERRVCYPDNMADRQPQRALTYCYLSQSAANQNKMSTRCHRWDSNQRPSARRRTSLTARPSPHLSPSYSDHQTRPFCHNC